MRSLVALCAYLIGSLGGAVALAGDHSPIVYREVPGAEPSRHYELSVRSLGDDGAWQTAFPWVTRCKQGIDQQNGYFKRLSGWTNTYINFEMQGPVEVVIARADGKPIGQAAAHPRRKVRACRVRDGKVYVTIDEPCLVAIDIDGQMDDQDTGKGYDGPPIHSVTIFANPILEDRPDRDGDGVLTVAPGQRPPAEGDWKTLYFLPGVHDIGIGFPVHANKQYYIPGDALVHGTMSNHDWADGHDIRIFGYGTLSGERISHPQFASPRPQADHEHNPIHIVGSAGTSVEGITLADSAHHSLMLISPFESDRPTEVRWAKIFSWRVNGDGINPFDNGLIEDCFIRTQDDSSYVNGRGIRRVTYWNDYNGSTFVLSALPNRRLIVEDCDVIYSRAGWHHWGGGRVFNMRGEGKGDCGRGVVFRNIRVEDSRPTLQPFLIAMQGVEPYGSPSKKRKPGNLSGVRFENIEIAAPSVLGQRDILWGAADAKITHLIFENVSIGGETIRSIDHFQHNEHVTEIQFE